jgi:hypothetical protein
MIGIGTKKTAWFLDVILIQCYMKNLVAAAVSFLEENRYLWSGRRDMNW